MELLPLDHDHCYLLYPYMVMISVTIIGGKCNGSHFIYMGSEDEMNFIQSFHWESVLDNAGEERIDKPSD